MRRPCTVGRRALGRAGRGWSAAVAVVAVALTVAVAVVATGKRPVGLVGTGASSVPARARVGRVGTAPAVTASGWREPR
ncbi:hypothetical protein ACFVYD_09740 [Streptomyces sp. NPDC058301]|uniref:hypothetical protein n=1 Tax=Streptomyces sp. NPDC058301 TaxID=3346436 RepID=UPI0036E80084